MEQKPQKDPHSVHPPTDGQAGLASGTLGRFTYRNPETGFAVVQLEPEAGGKAVCVVGALAQLREGQKVKVSGQYREHPRFGLQLEARTVEAVLPDSIEGINAYLSSKLVKGIGPATAARITAVFGEDTLRVIEEQPERLAEVRGLGRRRTRDLIKAVAAHKDIQAVMVFLRSHGLGQALAAKIVTRYGTGASALIQANPYRLADEVIGIGFRTADQLAGELGIAPQAPERIRAGILFGLAQAARTGHCYLPRDELVAAVAEILTCPPEVVDHELPELAKEDRLVIERPAGPAVLVGDRPPCVFPAGLYRAEVGVAAHLGRLAGQPARELPIQPEKALAWFVQRSGMRLPGPQRRAVLDALQGPVSVITGGPGVGKTTIIRALALILAAKKCKLLLAAPTGRAAKRLEESAGKRASTIHRLLEYQPRTQRFSRDEGAPLIGDMLVVDEASMLDVQLAHDLLRAVPSGMRLVLVGDVNQLPPVGPGNVLGDVIASGRVAVTSLTEIFRQEEDSLIVESAHDLLSGVIPRGGGEGSDFFFIATKNGEATCDLIRELVTHRIPSAFDLDAFRDVQVLCPMYRGPAGADNINRDLQRALNPGARSIERGGRAFACGDKVMQIRNDYEMEVFNGDIGRITRLDPDGRSLQVRFKDRSVEYAAHTLDQLVLAYAISVHRAQGSEYPAVVIPLATDHFMMLRRNLLYTAITRGKRLVVLVGSPKALAMAVRNNQEASRNSCLAERLREQMRRGLDPQR